jgi:hypothetical protein
MFMNNNIQIGKIIEARARNIQNIDDIASNVVSNVS